MKTLNKAALLLLSAGLAGSMMNVGTVAAASKHTTHHVKSIIKEKKHTYKTLKYGQKGTEVTFLQKRLHERGYSVAVSGTFDKKTEKSVMNFQKKFYLNETGEVDRATRTAVYADQTKPTLHTLNMKFVGWADNHSFEAISVDTKEPIVFQAYMGDWDKQLKDGKAYQLSFVKHQNGLYILKEVRGLKK
ncbi:hypothetical protein A374_17129 [Fictibacillus macauensis ZFHKF-1]|uniref:Peptidoglycan binding-like domain-containing protein n=1 Tax=Fictibacillus macauensis ZFHKF-1 TaxID=1196324 RepID=I8AFI4_9BACL|nr:peptidoglycan-binding domain-containing protein [Fictibacillus macauensis]EIT84124.1 hypothetical protein A374_17129 [Fictibacillus macauensis ZFHKF-1]